MKDSKKTFRKVDFNEYEGRYDASVNERLATEPEALTIEEPRAYLYGYTFTEKYAQGRFPDEMSMDYWRDREDFFEWEADEDASDPQEQFPLLSESEMRSSVMSRMLQECKTEETWDEEELADDFIDGILAEAEEEAFDFLADIDDDDYFVDTPQERRLLEAIDSTGDGKTAETALCVTDVGQEYEYIRRVFPYDMLEVERQSVTAEGIDCLHFAENPFGIDCIYFDMSRRFDVGYPL